MLQLTSECSDINHMLATLASTVGRWVTGALDRLGATLDPGGSKLDVAAFTVVSLALAVAVVIFQ